MKKREIINFVRVIYLSLILVSGVLAQGPIEAEESLKDSQNVLDFMKGRGLDTTRIQDLFQEAKIQFELKNYGRVIGISSEIKSLQLMAIRIDESKAKTSMLIESAKSMGINASDEQIKFRNALEDFKINNYEQADLMISNINRNLTKKIKEEILILGFINSEINKSALLNGINLRIVKDYQSDLERDFKAEEFSQTSNLKKKILMLNRSVSKVVESKLLINEVMSKNISDSKFSDLFEESLLSIELQNFDNAIDLTAQIGKLKDEAFFVFGRLDEVQNLVRSIEAEGIDVSESKALVNKAVEEFNLNHYQEANLILDKSIKSAQDAKASSLIFGVIKKSELKFNILSFLKNYWHFLLLSLVIATVFGAILYSMISFKMLKLRIAKLKKEIIVIDGLIKKLQEDYFKKKIISHSSYEFSLDNYQSRALKIRETIPVLESKLSDKEKRINFFRKF